MHLDDYHRERSEAVWRRNQRALGFKDADEKAENLRARFRTISRRVDRAIRLRRLRTYLRKRAIWICAFVGVVAGSYLAIAKSPWPIGLTVRHLLAAQNCDMARLVDLAPAYVGEPGYWARNDADDDGIACEPWPR